LRNSNGISKNKTQNKQIDSNQNTVAWKKAAAKLDVANELATNQSWRAKSKGTSPEIMHKWESVTHNQEEDSDRLSMLTTRISIKVIRLPAQMLWVEWCCLFLFLNAS
jgi:hypothetical protein